MKLAFNKYTCGAALIVAMGMPIANVALAENHNSNNQSNNVTSQDQNHSGQPNHNDKAGNNNSSNTNSDNERTTGDVVSDSWITSKVKSSFLTDGDIPGMDIKVETKEGVVSLSGKVKTSAERTRAIEQAQQIDGVKAVAAEALHVED